MQLVDVGVNLTHPTFARDPRAVVYRAFAAGVAHGVLYQFGEDGTLLTTASQTGLLPPR